MKQMITRKFAISSARVVTNNEDLELIPHTKSRYYLNIPDSCKLVNAIPPKQNFFYKIQISKDERQYEYTESGIAEIYKRGKRYFLKREHTFLVSTSVEDFRPRNGKPIKIEIPEDCIISVTSYIPDNFLHMLARPHSVICSHEESVPTPVELDNNCLLGRKDGYIQSIDKKELREILTDKEIIDAISSNKKSLILASNLETVGPGGRVSTSTLHLKPSPTPKKPSEGFLRYNQEDKCFEGYDGKKWRALIWES